MKCREWSVPMTGSHPSCAPCCVLDGLPALSLQQRAAALKVCMDFMATKYHLRNFGYQWIAGQDEALKGMLEEAGFSLAATLRDGWRTGESSFADVLQYHLLRGEHKPVPGRLGEQDNPGQIWLSRLIAGKTMAEAKHELEFYRG